MELRGRTIRINKGFLAVCDDVVANTMNIDCSTSQAVETAANTIQKSCAFGGVSVKCCRRPEYDGELSKLLRYGQLGM
jgi:hypothetical protein